MKNSTFVFETCDWFCTDGSHIGTDVVTYLEVSIDTTSKVQHILALM